jgi:excisionase family DNA binding protein
MAGSGSGPRHLRVAADGAEHPLATRIKDIAEELKTMAKLLTVGDHPPPPPNPLADNISTREAASHLGISERTLRQRQHDPEIAALRIDTGTRRRVYSRQRVLEYRARH